MNEEENTNEQSSEFVARVDSMDISDIKESWDDLFNEVYEIYPEDKK